MGKKASRRKAENGSAPSAVMVPCDAVSRDPNSGKATIYGVFDRIRGRSFPATASFHIFAKIFGKPGEYKFAVELSPASGKALRLGVEEMTFTIPSTGILEIGVEMAKLPFLGPGKHQLALVVGRQRISQPYYINVVQEPESKR